MSYDDYSHEVDMERFMDGALDDEEEEDMAEEEALEEYARKTFGQSSNLDMISEKPSEEMSASHSKQDPSPPDANRKKNTPDDPSSKASLAIRDTLEITESPESIKAKVKEIKQKPRAGAGVNRSLRKNQGYSVFYTDKMDEMIPKLQISGKNSSMFKKKPGRLDEATKYMRKMQNKQDALKVKKFKKGASTAELAKFDLIDKNIELSQMSAFTGASEMKGAEKSYAKVLNDLENHKTLSSTMDKEGLSKELIEYKKLALLQHDQIRRYKVELFRVKKMASAHIAKARKDAGLEPIKPT